MSEISVHIHHCIFYQFQLENYATADALSPHTCATLGQVLLRMTHVKIGLKDLIW